MRYTKEQLTEMASQYFERNATIELIYATEDNNFFYPQFLNSAQNHAKRNKVELFTIKKSDLIASTEDIDDEIIEDVIDDSVEEVEDTPKRGRKKKQTY